MDLAEQQIALTDAARRMNGSFSGIGVLIGVSAGAVGGAAGAACLGTSLARGSVLGALFGLAFAVCFSHRATSGGAGLIWGLASAFLLWIVFPAGLVPVFSRGGHSMGQIAGARHQFPELVEYLVCLGMPVGISVGIFGGLRK